MALMRGKLFAGALFAGLLLGQSEPAIPDVVQVSGGGGYLHKKLRHPWITKPETIFKQIIEDEELPESVQEEALAIIRPFIEKNVEVPKPSEIDWTAFAKDREKVDEIIRLWEEVVERQRLEIEEEENIELLLLVA